MPEPTWVLFDVDGARALGIRGTMHRDNAATIGAIEDFLAAR